MALGWIWEDFKAPTFHRKCCINFQMWSLEEKNVQNFYIFSNLVFLKNSGDSPFKHLAQLGVSSKFKINIGDYIYFLV